MREEPKWLFDGREKSMSRAIFELCWFLILFAFIAGVIFGFILGAFGSLGKEPGYVMEYVQKELFGASSSTTKIMYAVVPPFPGLVAGTFLGIFLGELIPDAIVIGIAIVMLAIFLCGGGKAMTGAFLIIGGPSGGIIWISGAIIVILL